MKRTPMHQLEELEQIEAACQAYLEKYPRNSGCYEMSFTPFTKSLRDGIVFYSSGWGWRLRKNWRDTLEQKRIELKRQADELSQWMASPPNSR